MNRTEAQSAVAPFIESVPQAPPYPPAQGVTLDNARALMGDGRFAAMQADKIRRGGPKPGYVYPWNVVDYLDDAANLSAAERP